MTAVTLHTREGGGSKPPALIKDPANGPVLISVDTSGGIRRRRPPRGAISGCATTDHGLSSCIERVLKLRYCVHGVESRPIRVSVAGRCRAQHMPVTGRDETRVAGQSRVDAGDPKSHGRRADACSGATPEATCRGRRPALLLTGRLCNRRLAEPAGTTGWLLRSSSGRTRSATTLASSGQRTRAS